MHARQVSALRKLHLILDAVLIVASMGLAASVQDFIRSLTGWFRAVPHFTEYASLVYVALPIWLGLIATFRLHHSFERVWSQSALILGLIKLHFVGLIALLLVQFVTQSIINRSLVAICFSCTFGVLYLERMLLGMWVKYQHRVGQNRLRILLVGRLSKRMGDFVRDAQQQPLPPHLVGYLQPQSDGQAMSQPPPDMAPIECAGSISKLAQILHEQAVDHVMFFPPCHRPEELKTELEACEQLAVTASFAVNLTQIAQVRPRLTTVYEHPFVSFEQSSKPPEWLALKHGLDPLLALVLIVVLSPLLLLLWAVVLIAMGRPVLFSQMRVGLHGRHFRMLKFRTMVRDAEARRETLVAQNEMRGPVFKIKDDVRVTPLGNILRRLSLDELPQLFNVLAGSMSLVGPRPLPVFEQDRIEGWQRRRLSMKPGITGLWQVSGRSQLDFEEWMLLDLKYVQEWSLWLDLMILLRTIPVVVTRRGAF